MSKRQTTGGGPFTLRRLAKSRGSAGGKWALLVVEMCFNCEVVGVSTREYIALYMIQRKPFRGSAPTKARKPTDALGCGREDTDGRCGTSPQMSPVCFS